jgi:hypothetical protein
MVIVKEVGNKMVCLVELFALSSIHELHIAYAAKIMIPDVDL